MTLEQAKYIKGKFLHLLGVKQADGTTYTDIIICPANSVNEFIKKYIADFRETHCLRMYPDSEYGIIGFDRNLLKQGVFAYKILSNVANSVLQQELQPVDAIIAILKMNRDIPGSIRNAEYEKLPLALFNENIRHNIGDMRLFMTPDAIQRAESFNYEFCLEKSSANELVFLNREYISE